MNNDEKRSYHFENVAGHCDDCWPDDLSWPCAYLRNLDHIQRLESDRAMLQDILSQKDSEIERLRTALEEVVSDSCVCAMDWGASCQCNATLIATAALADGEVKRD